MKNWNSHIFSASQRELSLPKQIEALLSQQRKTWDLFRNGEAALASITTKSISINGSNVTVQANPGRSISTNAKVDPGSIARRPCFLCPGALPEEERGIAYDPFVLLPNPYPVLPKHMTIAYQTHSPQEIIGHVNDFVTLAETLGDEMFILYNGPRCGASAPDHMHFQTAQSSLVPLFSQLEALKLSGKFSPLTLGNRNLFAGSFKDHEQAVSSLENLISNYRRFSPADQEPMMNIINRFANNSFTIALFPRAKHRSSCFFASENKRLSISPAAIEMAGIVVVSDINHFNRVDETAIRDIYREVTTNIETFNQLAEDVA